MNFLKKILSGLLSCIFFAYASDARAVNFNNAKCDVINQIDFRIFLGKKISNFSDDLNEIQDENLEYMGLYLLKKNKFKKFKIKNEINEVSIDVFKEKIVALTIGSFYESEKYQSKNLGASLNGCGVQMSSNCWKISEEVELDTSEFPRMIRISNARAVQSFYNKENYHSINGAPCAVLR